MLQQQIVDYAKSQLKLGVGREAIKNALLAAGWTSGDVDDSLVAAEASGNQSSPAVTAPAGPKIAFEPSKEFVKIPAQEKTTTVVVSDLIPKSAEKPIEAKQKKEERPVKLGEISVVKKTSFGKTLVANIALGVIATLAVAAAAFFYLGKTSATQELLAAKSENNSFTQKVADLNSQITSLTSNVTGLGTELDNLKKENQAVALELSFFAAPTGATQTNFSNLKGTLGGKNIYTIKTARGSVLTIKNSKDAAVINALKPLLGQEATLSGSYIPGSRELTVSNVNGTDIAP